MNTEIEIALISAGIGAIISGIFQLVNRVLDDRKEIRKDKKEEKHNYDAKKEEVYIAAIERLQQVRYGFDITRDDLWADNELDKEIHDKEHEFETVSARLRLYSSDEIFGEYYRLMFYARYAYAPQHGPRLMENAKEIFSQQVLILSRRMQADLGYREYNNDNTMIICPSCLEKHDAFGNCPKCGMKYTEYMRRQQISALMNENSVENLSPYNKEGYDSYFLLKFTDSYEHLKSFLDGKLYFNTSDYFALCDEEGRGDYTEGNEWMINPQKDEYKAGNLRLVDGRAMIEIVDYSLKPEEYKPGTIFSYSPAINRKRKLISFYTLYSDSRHNRIQPIDEKMESEFGEFGILITNTVEFYKRLEEGIRNHEGATNAQIGYVEYMDKARESGLMEFNPFLRPSEHNYQNEFRATFIDENTDPNDPVTIDIGDIRDIATPIFNGDVKEIFMKNGMLNYPIYTITESEDEGGEE